ncbi:hypothetical protein EGM97_23415 [Pseudomonas sp. AF32]|nr:hypothetical protein [Pseudomonas sp. AF32]
MNVMVVLQTLRFAQAAQCSALDTSWRRACTGFLARYKQISLPKTLWERACSRRGPFIRRKFFRQHHRLREQARSHRVLRLTEGYSVLIDKRHFPDL